MKATEAFKLQQK